VEAKVSSRLSIWGGVSGMAGGEGYSDVGATLGGKFSF
jgi:outer membrane autotransporter protein